MNYQFASAFAEIDTTIFIGTYAGIFQSSDNGSDWNVNNYSNGDFRAFLVKDSKLYVGGDIGGLYFSPDS